MVTAFRFPSTPPPAAASHRHSATSLRCRMQTTESHYETVRTMPPWVRAYAETESLDAPPPSGTFIRAAGQPRLPGQTMFFTHAARTPPTTAQSLIEIKAHITESAF